jgi:hypothetical protein
MGGVRRRASILGLLLLLVMVVGCGGGGEETTSADAGDKDSRPYPWLKGPTREFLVPVGGDNVVQTFGREATAAEREQASQVIHAWMKARAAKDWEKDCSYMSRIYRRILTVDAHGVTDGKVKSCPEALAYFGPAASGDFVNNLDGPIDSLRVQGKQGFAQYHGNDGRDWVVPMDKEDGKWLVRIAAPIDRMK